MDIKIYKIDGTQTEKSAVLHPEVYNIKPNDHAIYLDVKSFMASQRKGTAKTKERGEITGSTRKLYRQKGTGRARRGSKKSPLLRGGGRVFGPHPRDYRIKVNKKVKMLARKSALTYKALNENITVIDEFLFEQIKTKQIVEMLKNFNYTDKKVLLILNESDKNVILSSRNLKNIKVIRTSEINTYQVLWANKVVFTESSLKDTESILLN